MSGERLKKSWRNKKNQVTITMWVSLQIILDRKDAYPEELISLAVHSFWQSAKLSFFSSSLRSNSEPAKKNNNKKKQTTKHTQEQLKLIMNSLWLNLLSVKKNPRAECIRLRLQQTWLSWTTAKLSNLSVCITGRKRTSHAGGRPSRWVWQVSLFS